MPDLVGLYVTKKLLQYNFKFMFNYMFNALCNTCVQYNPVYIYIAAHKSSMDGSTVLLSYVGTIWTLIMYAFMTVDACNI